MQGTGETEDWRLLMDRVRWGLLSTADINSELIPVIRASERGELVAVASRDLEKAQAYAAEWEIPQAFGSYEAMLESGDIDAVYIGLPNHLHATWSISAMQAGKHVLCEKPLATSVDEVDRMAASSGVTGCKLAEAFMYRHHPQTKIAGEWARSGRLGEITVVRGTFNFPLEDRGNIRLVPEYGGGCLWDVGVYPLSFAQFILGGAPQRVAAEQWVGDSGVDEVFTSQMYYADGRLAQITSSFRTPFYASAEIIGTAGRLFLTKAFNDLKTGRRMTFYPKEGEPQEVPVPEEDLYLGEVEDMHAAILDGVPNYLTLEESREHIRTAVALYQAAERRQVVYLD
jgi:xylose dehydrogenase (NAD/NADP)